MTELKIALLGIGGFAENYVHAMKKPQREAVRLVGAVDPFVKECPLCPVYATTEELYKAHQPDIVVVGTPIQFHAEHAIEAFEHGCHVVMEKPIAATMEGARSILAARDKAGKKLSIGFQLCFEPAVRQLKADLDAGVYGALKSLKAIVLPPRGRVYYRRGSGWAGKRFDAEGRPIFDDVLSNATAHYLMNMLYMTGAPVASIEYKTYRANPIETYDTAVAKGVSETSAELFIAVSHAAGAAHDQPPMFEYTCEKAVIRFGKVGKRGQNLVAYLTDGSVKDYGSVETTYMENLWNMVDAVRDGAPLCCPGEVAMRHVDALEKARALRPEAEPFPERWIQETDGMLWVPGLAEKLYECYNTCELPHWDLNAAAL